ncbi:MAG: hypothetical protein E7676_02555 [Ruminococcaceae bacterium]|nr:hypothetical protein [Oscillospiraceae bacterium]
MRIDKAQLEAIAAMPDDKLWATVVSMARGYGFSLPDKTPPHEDLEKLRAAVSADKINVSDAMRLLNSYRKGK